MNYIYQVWEYYDNCEDMWSEDVDYYMCIRNFASLPDAVAFANEYMQKRAQEAITVMSKYYEDYPLPEFRFRRRITTTIYPIHPVDEHKYSDGTIYRGRCVSYAHTYCEFTIKKVPLY